MAAVLKLRGLPWSATEADVAQFFRPLAVGLESVTLISENDRPSGEGYVWIHEDDMDRALRYDRKNMGSRYVEVFPSDEPEYTRAVQTSNSRSEPPRKRARKASAPPTMEQTAMECVLRIRGLPFSAGVEDIAETFSDYGVEPSDVYIGVCSGRKSGAPSGDGYIRCKSKQVAQKALNNAQGVTLGSRYLELFPATEDEIEEKANLGKIAGYEANQTSHGEDINPQENRDSSGWIRLRGIPFTATQQDIVDFCSQFHVAEDDITIKYGSDGRPSGEAFVQLESEETAQNAVSALDRKHMGSRYLEVFMSTHEESQARGRAARGGKRARR